MNPATEPAAVSEGLLRVAWSALGGDAALLDHVTVRGSSGGLLPSVFPVLPAMVAAVSASTLAVSVLHAARGSGSPRQVLIDAEHVAAAALSERFPRAEGPPEADLCSPFTLLSNCRRMAAPARQLPLAP